MLPPSCACAGRKPVAAAVVDVGVLLRSAGLVKLGPSAQVQDLHVVWLLCDCVLAGLEYVSGSVDSSLEDKSTEYGTQES